ncbi:MAG: insulinase family protein [Myxococcales bacterium FL481]|nr:MAG: insulinase family protein [Myxococcales bacterium FL481]
MRRCIVLAVLSVLSCRPGEPPAAPPAAVPSLPATGPSDAEILAASDLPAPLGEPLAHDPVAATVWRLSNGMTVYISTDRSTPRFSGWIAVRAGSRSDPADSTGLAHYLEHMLFKGSQRLGTLDYEAERPHLVAIEDHYRQLRGTADAAGRQAIFAQIDAATQRTAATAIPNEIDTVYAAMGFGGVNAFTGDDVTAYIADVPSNRLEQWARVEADRFQQPVFRLFFIELEAVYEEKNRSLDNPQRRVQEALARALFPDHPYGSQSTLGTIEHLKTPAYDDMAAFYRRWYVPNNMAIFLAGDIDASTALPVLERHFGAWKPRPLTSTQPGQVEPWTERRFVEVVAPGEQSVTIAWPTVPSGHPDQAALKVMDMIVDNATTGILNVDVLLPQKLPAAASGHNFLAEAGHWTLRGTAKEGQELAAVEGLLMSVVDKLLAGQFTQSDIDAVVLAFEIETKRRMESNQARAYAMMASFITREPWEQASRELERLRRVTAADVLRVAKSYLGPGRAVVHRKRGEHTPPKIVKPTITPINVDPSRHSAMFRDTLAMPTTALEPKWLVEGSDYEKLTTPQGPLIASRNDRNDLWSATFVYDVGSRLDDMQCYALRLAERSGAGELDAASYRRALYALGTSVDVSCDVDRTQITVRGVDRNLEASMELVRAWLARPRPADDLLAGLLENTLTERRAQVEEPSGVFAALSSFARFDGRSPFLNVPSNAKLERARSKRLLQSFTRLGSLSHRTLYFGPRDASAVAPRLALGTASRRVQPVEPTRFRRVRGNVVYFLHKPTAQAQISVLLPHEPLPRAERPTVDVLNRYLGGGMGGLIFQEMREARGLAYSAGARYVGGRRPQDESGLIGRIGTQVDKTPEAVNVMLELLRAPAQPQRLQAALDQVEEAYRTERIAPRGIGVAVYAWDERGEKADPRPWQREQSQAVDKAALDRFIATANATPVILAILGDRDRIDLAALREVGKLVEVGVDDVFGYGAFASDAALNADE